MEPFDRRSGSGEHLASSRPVSSTWTGGRPVKAVHVPKSYRLAEGLTGGLVCFMIVFTPWAFGTTQDWAIWTMNITGYVLGALLLAKWVIRQQTGCRPARWGQAAEPDDSELITVSKPKPDYLTLGLAALTLLTLAYILVSALNARATFLESQRRFEYRDCINWLPHSYDSVSTWNCFWMYAGLACFFWAARDWLLGKGGSGRRKRRHSSKRGGEDESAPPTHGGESRESNRATSRSWSGQGEGHSSQELPGRLRLVLWVLCINGAVLALEAILQRLSGTNKLLWLIKPEFNDSAESQFGPYAYRANAASYFNLIWPVSVGYWLTLRQAAGRVARVGTRVGAGNYLVLLPGAVLMAACPIISTTRGGAVVSGLSILLMMGLLLWSTRHESKWFRIGACSLFAVILVFSGSLGFSQLAERFKTVFTDQMSHRTEIYENAVRMAHDFPILGSGPGTFGSLYQLYRTDLNQDWAAYDHDDWLETRITFGALGTSMILLMLALVCAHWPLGRKIPVAWELTATFWVALAGCLLHAKFDFPFQIYSILFLFLLLCAMLSCMSKRALNV